MFFSFSQFFIPVSLFVFCMPPWEGKRGTFNPPLMFLFIVCHCGCCVWIHVCRGQQRNLTVNVKRRAAANRQKSSLFSTFILLATTLPVKITLNTNDMLFFQNIHFSFRLLSSCVCVCNTHWEGKVGACCSCTFAVVNVGSAPVGHCSYLRDVEVYLFINPISFTDAALYANVLAWKTCRKV